MKLMQSVYSQSSTNFKAVTLSHAETKVVTSMLREYKRAYHYRKAPVVDAIKNSIFDIFKPAIENKAKKVSCANNLSLDAVFNVLQTKFRDTLTALQKLQPDIPVAFRMLCNSVEYTDKDNKTPLNGDVITENRIPQENPKNSYCEMIKGISVLSYLDIEGMKALKNELAAYLKNPNGSTANIKQYFDIAISRKLKVMNEKIPHQFDNSLVLNLKSDLLKALMSATSSDPEQIITELLKVK